MFTVRNRAPLGLDLRDRGAAPFGDVAHASTEHAVDPDDDLVSRFEQVDKTGLHAGAAGGADRESHLVFRLENLPEH